MHLVFECVVGCVCLVSFVLAGMCAAAGFIKEYVDVDQCQAGLFHGLYFVFSFCFSLVVLWTPSPQRYTMDETPCTLGCHGRSYPCLGKLLLHD